MAIEPNTTIKIYHNVPLDVKQDRSIAWASISEQNIYFHANNDLLKFPPLSNNTYQRVRKGVMRIEHPADDLYDCNYLAFQNTNYGNKWFYAFITNVEYVNDLTSEVTYVIDELQTWYFEMQLQPCIVERCHTTTDRIGEHIEPEPVTLGEYVINNRPATAISIEQSYRPIINLSDLCVIVATVDTDTHIIGGKIYDGVYGGATLRAFRLDDYQGINTYLESWLVIPDSVLAIYMIPEALIHYPIIDGGTELENDFKSTPYTATWEAISATFDIDGYHPKNNKLYTYPYNYVQVDNANGNMLKLRYEFFKDLTPCFEISGTVSNPVELMLRPYNYRNCTYGETTIYDHKALNTETLSINMFPLCSWSYDGFQAWIVNTGIPYGLSVGGTFADMAIGAMTGMPTVGSQQIGDSRRHTIATTSENYPNMVQGGLASGFLNTYYSALTVGQQDIIKGNYSCGGVNCARGKQQFYGCRMSITHQYAEIIDNFFSMYGYTCMKLQTPNLRARPHWTYVKTRGCNMSGSLPAISKENIQNIFDRGITFWKVPSEIGDYTLDNHA